MTPRQKRAEPEPEPVDTDTDDLDDGTVYEGLTSNATYSVSIGSEFSYRAHNHWPKVRVEDGMALLGIDEDDQPVWEGYEAMVTRIEETAHQRLAGIIERMKLDIDERAAADQAARSQRYTQ